MFRKILIANRGEIACRVIDTAHKLGIRCVAVYSEADANARHVRMADEAYLLGPAPSKDSYLRSDKIIDIAKQSGAEAIHPGYGFLSENAEFARRCRTNNIIFIGPDPEIMDALGDKVKAKKVAIDCKVPIIESSKVALVSTETAHKEAQNIGYPVLLKAAAGGGGRGMRVLNSPSELDNAFGEAKREAYAADITYGTKNEFGFD